MIRHYIRKEWRYICKAIAYLGISKWLQTFAYHIDLDAWHVVLPVLFVSVIALCVISMHTVKATISNPVDALKHE
jgi:putative ABC transport system permease protein